MTVKDRKQAVLNEIIASYNNYYGNTKSGIEQQLKALKQAEILTTAEYDNLLSALAEYKQYILGILSNSLRVRVSFNNNPIAQKQRQNGGNYPLQTWISYLNPCKNLKY